jgi:hypothetical protein
MKCPLCDRNLFHNMFHDQGEYHCPVHGPFYENEMELSPQYHEFKSRVHGIRGMTGAISRFVREDERKKDIDTYLEMGYNDGDEILDEKGDLISDPLIRGQLTLFKAEVERYAQAIEYKHTGEMVEANKEIVEQHRVGIKDGKQYQALDILGSSRNLIAHISRNRKKEKKPEILDDLQKDLPDIEDDLSFLRDQMIINDENVLEPIYPRGLSKDEVKDRIINSPGPRSNRSKSSSKLFGECLIDTGVEVIRQMEMTRSNH